jgi:phosphate transport system permease protein
MAVADSTLTIRDRVLGASRRIRRVKATDRLATALITFGGIFIIIAVCFIFVFILAEALPLFRPAQGEARGTLALAAVPEPPAETTAAPTGETAGTTALPPAAGETPTQAELTPSAPAAIPAAPGEPLLIGTDEYQLYLYELLSDGRVVFFHMKDGSLARQFPLAGLVGAGVAAASRSLQGDFIGVGTNDGRALLYQVRFVPQYQEQTLVDLELQLRERGAFELDAAKRPLREISYEEHEGRKAVAAIVGDDEIAVLRTDDEGSEHHASVRTQDGDRVTHVVLERGEGLVAAGESGRLYRWDLAEDPPRLTEAVQVAEQPITALAHVLGGVTVIVGDAGGNLSGWFRVRRSEDDTELHFVNAHRYAAQGSSVRAIGASTRGKSFVTAGADGSIALHHMTSERRLIHFPATGRPVDFVLLTPRMDGVYAKRADGQLARYDISSPHPEVSWKTLFGKVWYEGYPKPEYVWQSTGATDDFESKLSLVPLIFGTIKATLYAMLFALPLAVMGALYTSQFMHPSIKAKVKPTVEIMAALPSVVIGFIGGLWLASRVEKAVVPVLLMVLVLPLFGTAGILLWERLPRAFARRLRPGMELAVIVPLLVLGGWLALQLGPWLEGLLFGGDFRLWLNTALGLVYDQRNSLIVGLAMGFAVIPIIFTISEDAFTSVPQHLAAASLALGASRWQTATRVVLPTASPGVFSAAMIGFGRAVGETMIVLMATGNTPLLDWSIFNGMRTLSANIAVEVPEAPYGATLYRTLFVSGLLLFVMTFFVNTLAELVRQRLRDRYKAI